MGGDGKKSNRSKWRNSSFWWLICSFPIMHTSVLNKSDYTTFFPEESSAINLDWFEKRLLWSGSLRIFLEIFFFYRFNLPFFISGNILMAYIYFYTFFLFYLYTCIKKNGIIINNHFWMIFYIRIWVPFPFSIESGICFFPYSFSILLECKIRYSDQLPKCLSS